MSDLNLLRFVLAYTSWITFLGGMLGCIAGLKDKSLRGITAVLLLTFVNEQIDSYCAAFFKQSYITYHFFNPLQFLFLCWFFHDNFEDEFFRKIVKIAAGVSIVFTIINSIFFQGLSVNPGNFLLLETFLLITLSTFLFIEKLGLPASENIFKNPVFISSLAILSFNIFSFVWFLLIDYFRKHNLNYFSSISKVIYFSNILYYGLLFVAILFSLKFTHKNRERAPN